MASGRVVVELFGRFDAGSMGRSVGNSFQPLEIATQGEKNTDWRSPLPTMPGVYVVMNIRDVCLNVNPGSNRD